MAWLWESWEAFVDRVHPVEITNSGHWDTAQYESLFETDCHLASAAERVSEALRSLFEMGFTVSRLGQPAVKDASVLGRAHEWVLRGIHDAELLLLYDKELVQCGAAYEFLHEHTLLEHWERYAKTTRIFIEIGEFVRALGTLNEGYSAQTEGKRAFLLSDLKLPDDLSTDFREARDLFSVGLDETGLLIAGRGLEGVLRRMMDVRKITFCSNPSKGKPTPASEADFRDLIEIAGQLRWKRTGTRLITPDVRHLLHYLRAKRNSGAHSGAHPNGGNQPAQSAREVAMVITQTANQLWNAVTSTRARLESTCVNKTW